MDILKVHKKWKCGGMGKRKTCFANNFVAEEFACKAVRKDKQIISFQFKECVLAFGWDGCGM